MLPGYSPRERG